MPPVDEAVRSDERSGLIPPPLRAGIGLVASGVETATSVSAKASAKVGRAVGNAIGDHLGDVATFPLRGLTFLAKAREVVLARLRGTPDPAAAPTPTPARAAAPTPTPEALDEITNPFGLSDQIVEAIDEAKPGAVLAHDELPLDDYDHLTLGSLRARLARLDAVALVQLLDYERAHAHRIQVLTMLENRIAKVGKTT